MLGSCMHACVQPELHYSHGTTYFLQPAERTSASFLFIETKAVDRLELEQDKIKKLKFKIVKARETFKQRRQDFSIAEDRLKKLEKELILSYEHSQALQSDSFRQATPVNRRSVVFHQGSAAASTSSFGQANRQLTLQEASNSATNIAQRSDHEQVCFNWLHMIIIALL